MNYKMLPANTHFIRNAVTVKPQSEKKLMDGIVSGSLDTFQRGAIDGILKSGMPAGKVSPHGHKPDLHKAEGKSVKTKRTDGFMPYPGASSH